MTARTVAAVTLVSGALLVLSACGGEDEPPTYSKETVCGVAVDAVADVMGTDKFTVGQSVTRSTDDLPPAPGGGDLPLSKGEGGITKMECEVRTVADAPTLSFSFSLANGVDADELLSAVNDSEEPFEIEGGIATTSFAGNNHASWRWVCTTPSESSSVPIAGGSVGQDDLTEDQRRALVKAVAVAAGCPAVDPTVSR